MIDSSEVDHLLELARLEISEEDINLIEIIKIINPKINAPSNIFS